MVQIGPQAFLLGGLSGREALSQLFSYQLDLLAESENVPLDGLVGQSVTVELALAGGGTRFFSGIASRVTVGARSGRLVSYRAEIVPRVWLLTRTQHSRIFERTSVPQILAAVLAGFGEVESRLVGSYEPRDYCVQYRESDFNFASRLMEEEGIYYYFKDTAAGHTLVLGDTPAAHVDVPGPSAVAFDPTGAAHDATPAVVLWEKTQELRAGKVTLRDHNFQLPGDPLEAQATIRESVRAGQVTHRLRVGGNAALEKYDFPGRYAERFDGIDPAGGEQPAELQKIFPVARKTASVRMDEETVPSLAIAGTSNARQLTSGHRFALTGHPNADGAYVLTSVQHSVKVHDPRAGDRGLRYENSFTCIPESLPYRPPRRTPQPTVPGTQTAVVVGPPGEQVFTDKYGRVKVQFFWDRDGKSDANSSRWVRVQQLLAGSGRGVFWRPEIGDEVIVAFEDGDPDRPYVLGSLYNPRRPPPPQ